MQITKITFGVTVSRDYQAKRYDLEAVLEPWENYEESFKQLRDQVCDLANVHPGEYLTAAEKAEDLKLQISENQAAIEARRAENSQLLAELIKLRQVKHNILDFSDAMNALARNANYKLSQSLERGINACEKLIPLLPQEEDDQPQSDDLETEFDSSDKWEKRWSSDDNDEDDDDEF